MIRSVAIFALFFASTSSELRSGFNLSRCGQDTICSTWTIDCGTKNVIKTLIGTHDAPEAENACQIRTQAKRISEFTYLFIVSQSGLKNINETKVVYENITAPCRKIPDESSDCTAEIEIANVTLTQLDESFKKFTIQFYNKGGYVASVDMNKGYRDKLWKTNTCYSSAFYGMALNSTDDANINYIIKRVDTTAQVLKCEEVGYRLSLIRVGSAFEMRIRVKEIACVNTPEGYEWQANYEPGKNGALAVFIQNSPGDELEESNTTFVKYLDEKIAIGCVKLENRCCPEPRLFDCPGCIKVPKNGTDTCFKNLLQCPDGSQLRVSNAPADDDHLIVACAERSYVNEEEDGYDWLLATNGEIVDVDKNGREIRNAIFQKVEKMACQWNETMRNSTTNDAEEGPEVRPMEHKGPHERPKDRKEEPDEPKTDQNWLAANWLSHILVPLIIFAAFIGGIVFIVCVIRTKDQQDNFQREQQRREAERAEDGPSFRSPLLQSSIQSTNSDFHTSTRSGFS